uniref:taste receptor type 2 member 134-like n=1 Tax=Jaculus jaculus TaxID=51337 RepID=UPI001E1B3C0A|nr:taste receptor type 2 member 134-like [Jaculus jaculus]
MYSSFTLIFTVIFCLETLVALLQNGFMVGMLGREWVQSRTLPAGDMIVACLAASRFCLHGLAFLNNFLAFMFCYKISYLGILWDFSNTLTFWLTTWLAIFYCVKISSFSHPIFFWLKWRISRSVPRLLLVSLIIGGLSCISSTTGHVISSPTTVFYVNCTLPHIKMTFYQRYYRYHAMLLWVIPFFLFLTSIILLMFSLYRHMGQMRDFRSGAHNPSTQAHTMALKSLAFFLVFYTLYVLSLTTSTTKIIIFQSPWNWAWEVVTYTGISLHSIILMLSSPKLRKALKMRFADLCTVCS